MGRQPIPFPLGKYYIPEKGARLQPQVCVRIVDAEPIPKNRLQIVTAEPSQGRTYKDIAPLEGPIPQHWRHSCLTASAIARFVILNNRLEDYIIPTAENGTLLSDLAARRTHNLWARSDDSFQAANRQANRTLGTLLYHIAAGGTLASILSDGPPES